MKKIKVTHFSDGGHSWLAVKRSLIESLGIQNDISGCSYQRGETVYLEEDCDLTVFLKAYFKGNIPNQWATHFEIKNSYSDNSPVRNYYRYSPKRAPKLEEKMRFKLYGATFTASYKKGTAWICVKDGEDGVLYKLNTCQLVAIEVIA